MLPYHLSHMNNYRTVKAKRETAVLVRVIAPDSQVEIGLLLHSGSKEECVWSAS